MILFPFLKKTNKQKNQKWLAEANALLDIVLADVHCPREKTDPILRPSTCKFRNFNIFHLKWSMWYE